MGDMNDDGYETMVCVEATRYGKDLASGALLMPGEKGALSTEISVTRRHKDPPARPRWGRRGGEHSATEKTGALFLKKRATNASNHSLLSKLLKQHLIASSSEGFMPKSSAIEKTFS